MFAFFRSMQSQQRTNRSKVAVFRPWLERLEDRTLLSASAVSYLQAPLSFQANVGQADPSVQFLSQGSGYSLGLTPTEATLALLPTAAPPTPGQMPALPSAAQSPTLLHMQLVGANVSAQGTAMEEQTAKTNYQIGSDRNGWHMDVANYGKVQYQGVYNGVNVVYYGNNQGQLGTNLGGGIQVVTAPGAVQLNWFYMLEEEPGLTH